MIYRSVDAEVLMRNDSRLLPTAQRAQRASPPFFSDHGCVVRYEEIGWSGAGVDGPRNLYGQVTFFPSGVCASLRRGVQPDGGSRGLQAHGPMHNTKLALAPGLSYMLPGCAGCPILRQVARSSTPKDHHGPWEAVPRSSRLYRDERGVANIRP